MHSSNRVLMAGAIVLGMTPVFGPSATGLALAWETIQLHSGNGPHGGPDAQITMLSGPMNGPFGFIFTPADFAAADAGPAASVIFNHGAWIPVLPGDPVSRWISNVPGGVSDGGTALFSQEFFVATPVIGTATLDFFFAVDNVLGSGGNVGVYLNGQPVPGTVGGSFGQQYTFLGLNVDGFLQPGSNRLHVYAVDQGGPGGLIYRAELAIEPGQTVDAREPAASFQLGEAWPNPFNPLTIIPFELAETTVARLAVHDLAGREVAVLHDGLAARGAHQVSFDAAGLPAGIYFYSLQTAARQETRKLLLVK